MNIVCKRITLAAATLAAASSLVTAQGRVAPKFYSDDPIARVPDTQDAAKVQERELSLYYDAIINLFGRPGKREVGRATSVNTIDEVPDSSWFTNRAGSRTLTADEVMRGPNDDRGPAAGKWEVSRKANGVSPGFTITDARGKRYFIKFDPPGEPELGTATEVIVTRLFHALGYHVPQASIATLRPSDLAIAADARVRTRTGGRRAMKQSDIDEQLSRAHPNPDGTYRVVAGEALPGQPLGGFKYEGTRPDDPNDVIPHEDRRELRGLRVFSAWVNHTDAKAINSLDTLVAEGGRRYVRHNLIDFNAALGSAGIGKRERRDGYEYLAEFGPAKRSLLAFGFVIRPWMRVDYPQYRGVGRFEAEAFDPETWRPRVPNPAYVRSRPDDTFWAARKLMALSDDLVRAAVRAGMLSDPQAEEFLVDALISRRNRIGRAFLTKVNPVVDPALAADGTLTFKNAAVQHGVASAPSAYKAVWHRFDNNTGEARRLGETEGSGEQLRAPSGLPSDRNAFVRIDISAAAEDHPSWSQPVHAYFRRADAGWSLVGFDRLPGAPPMRPGLVGAEQLGK
ncbi:MAG: hypothetical protein ACRD1U_00490 [Vicinamibacterales bacterium]